MQTFEQSMAQCTSTGVQLGAQVDLGMGFWTEHAKMCSPEEWFCVKEKEDVLAQLLDSYLLRQKVTLHLDVGRSMQTQYESTKNLHLLSFSRQKQVWPEEAEVSVPEEFFIDTDDDEQDEGEVQSDIGSEEIIDHAADGVAEALELEEPGQQRFWIRRDETNCCPPSATSSGILCEKAQSCLVCSAQRATKRDAHYGLFIHNSVASLYVHARAHNWQALPDNKIFDFIVELDNRLIQHPLLRKELSYYGAIRCTTAEVLEALDKKQLLQYRVDIAHKGHTFYCRMTMDPMNQVYANWLITIAGSRHRTLRTTNPLKLGDMVETALGLCRFID